MTVTVSRRGDARPPPRTTQGPGSEAGAGVLDAALSDNRATLKLLFPLAAAASEGDASAPPPLAAGAAGRRRPHRGVDATLRNGSCVVSTAALAVAALLWIDPAWHHEHHASAIGERRTVPLPDGSRVTLDTASTLDVAWHLRSRRAVLHRGQARFEVAPADATRPADGGADEGRARRLVGPFGTMAQGGFAAGVWLASRLQRSFEVDAGAARVRVLGTVFDVRLRERETTVTVLEGRVAVLPRSATPTESADVRVPGPGNCRSPACSTARAPSRCWRCCRACCRCRSCARSTAASTSCRIEPARKNCIAGRVARRPARHRLRTSSTPRSRTACASTLKSKPFRHRARCVARCRDSPP